MILIVKKHKKQNLYKINNQIITESNEIQSQEHNHWKDEKRK